MIPGAKIAAKLQTLLAEFQGPEFLQLVSLLGRSLQGLAALQIRKRSTDRALAAVLSAVRALPIGDPISITLPRPSSTALLVDLRAEAQGVLAPLPHGGGTRRTPRADLLATAPSLLKLAEGLTGPLLPTGNSRYESVAPNSSWRVDDESLLLRMVLALDPCLIAHRRGDGVRELALPAGTACLLWPGLTVHRLSADIAATVLSVDFYPKWAPHNAPPFVRTPRAIARAMLRLVRAAREDNVYDLGCGNGEILLVASKEFGSRARGIELSAELCERARARLARAGVTRQCTIIQGDLSAVDLRDADVVTIFLNPDENERARKRIEATASKGCRVVSHLWPLRGWAPTHIEYVTRRRSLFEHRIYLYHR